MTIKEVSERLNGREYGSELLPGEENELAEAGIVVVFGYSDDNIEFRGATYSEVGCWEEINIPIIDGMPFEAPCINEDCPLLRQVLQHAKYIHAEFGREGWRFSTDFPSEKFLIYEDGEVYGEGLVYSLDDVKEGAKG